MPAAPNTTVDDHELFPAALDKNAKNKDVDDMTHEEKRRVYRGS